MTYRRIARAYARQRGGPPAVKVLRAYQQTMTEIAFLHQHWRDLDDAELARALSRTMGSVERKRRALRLKRDRVITDSRQYMRP